MMEIIQYIEKEKKKKVVYSRVVLYSLNKKGMEIYIGIHKYGGICSLNIIRIPSIKIKT